MVETLLSLYRLKDEQRRGWLLRGVRDAESVADHSWGTALLCVLYAPGACAQGAYAPWARVDRLRVLEMALVHDLAEAETGDVPTRVATLDSADASRAAAVKRRAEAAALDRLTARLPRVERERVVSLWTEYEERQTPEARLVRDLNLIDMLVQATLYERDGRYLPGDGAADFPDFDAMDEFFATSAPRLSTELGRELYGELLAAYNLIPSVAARGGFHLAVGDGGGE